MTITRIDPEGLPTPTGYTQVTVATGGRIVHVSGQVGVDAAGKLAGEDLGAQAEQAFRNLVTALSAAGASLTDVAKITFFVVDYTPDALGALFGAAATVLGADMPITASTLLGVACLSDPSHKIEIEATAVIP
jgi:enamine deaminase RidA (YjgF/YER057c/UK114 family)